VTSVRKRLIIIQFGETPTGIDKETVGEARVAQAIGGGGGAGEDDDLQARLDGLRR
jgi:charged multivesicular body protein 2A